ncbi:MAG: DUF4143 domain-containing protein, partial [Bacteroidota bacterium]
PVLGLKADPTVLRNFLVMLSHLHGEQCKYDILSRSLGLSVPTIKKYINFFAESFLIRILPPYFFNIKKRLVRSPRIYFKDSGLLHAMLGIETFVQLQGHPGLGKSWEGYVIDQICQLLDERYEFCFYKTHQGAEIDLVLIKGGKAQIAIEIKYHNSPKISKGFYISIQDLQTPLNFIITPNSDDYKAGPNIQVCSLHRFLTGYVPTI